MRWSVFFVFAYLLLALETGLDKLLVYGTATPSLLLILAVFVGLSAPPMTVVWSMLILGLLTDLTRSYDTADQQTLWLIGPAAVGYLCGALTILQLRALVVRDSLIALAVMVFVVGVFIYLVTVAMLTLRGLPLPWSIGEPIAHWSPAGELVSRFGELVYCAVVTFPLGLVLFKTERIWGFQVSKGRSRFHPHLER